GHDKRGRRQLERHRDALREHGRHRETAQVRDPEVTPDHSAEPKRVLHRKRAVEAHEHPCPRQLLGGHVRAEQRDRGIAGNEVDHEPDAHRRQEKHRQKLDQAEQDVPGHQALCSARPAPPRSTRTWSVSARALSDSTDNVITMPGNRPYQGAWWRNERPVLSIEPQEGVGGWVPSPRNDSAASSSIATAPVTAT